MAKKITLYTAIFLLIGIGLAPVLSIFIRSFIVNGEFTLASYGSLFRSGREWRLLFNSIALASSTTLITILTGVPLGILFVKTDLPVKKFFTVLFIAPLLVPSYIMAIAWFYCLGRSGVAASILGANVGIITSNLLFGFCGSLFVMVSVLLPIVIILSMTYLRMVNPDFEEAAMLSASWPVVLRKITLPVISPGIAMAALIVFILTIGEFGVPSSLRFDVYAVESFVQFSAFYDFNTAIAAAIPLGVIVLIILTLERLFLRKKTFRLKTMQSDKPMIMIRLGRAKPFYVAAVSTLVFVLVLIPFSVLIYKSFSSVAYTQAIVHSVGSILRSLFYASVGATSLTIFGFFLGYILERKSVFFPYFADSMVIFLFALPGTVIGIGLISLWNTQGTNFIYTSMIIIIFGYVAQYAAVGERIMSATFANLPCSMEEAVQSVGGGWFHSLSGILIPLVKRGLIVTWLVSFIFCLKDMGITMMVYPPAHDTLPVRIFTIMANSPEDVIAALCMIMVVITLLPLCAIGLAKKYLAVNI
ncbi:MAG: ABC transporter permease [Candidatus Anammoxibacter sp.]